MLSIFNASLAVSLPPSQPKNIRSHPGTTIEFFFPHPIYLDPDLNWAPLQVRMRGVDYMVHKPTTGRVNEPAAEAKGNQATDQPYSIWTIETVAQPVDPFVAFDVIYECANWVRILGRQSWIFYGATGIAATCRGSEFTRSSSNWSQRNFVGVAPSVVLRPFSEPLWQSVGKEIASGNDIPTADSVFCDGLQSLMLGNYTKALVEMGVAAEVELTQLCDEIVSATPGATGSIEYADRQSNHRDSFGWKLAHASNLGLADPHTYAIARGPKKWTSDLELLYKFRNGSAHAGRPAFRDNKTGGTRQLQKGDLQHFVFAVEALFHWSQLERVRLGLPKRNYQLAFDARPIICIIEAEKRILMRAVTQPTTVSSPPA